MKKKSSQTHLEQRKDDEKEELKKLSEGKPVYTCFEFDFYDDLQKKFFKEPVGTSEIDALKEVFKGALRSKDIPYDGNLDSYIEAHCKNEKGWWQDFKKYFSTTIPDFDEEFFSDVKNCDKVFDVFGKKAISTIPNYNKSKINPTNVWTRYAMGALLTIAFNKIWVSWLKQTHITGNYKCFSRSISIDRKKYNVNYYVMDDKVVVIAEWQEKCLELPDRLTTESEVLKKFLEVIKELVLLFWMFIDKKEYNGIFKMVNWGTFLTEARKRHGALDQIAKAVKSIAKQDKKYKQ